MNKKLLSALLLGAAALTIGSAVKAECNKGPCEIQPPPQGERPCPPEFKKPPMNEEAKDAKKAEFEKRIQLTRVQKAQLEKIKSDEKKLLEPIHKKMAKKNEEMKDLIKKENDVRTESMKKFDAILTTDQKAELEKIKSEIHEQMKKDFEDSRPQPMDPKEEVKGPECPQKCPLNQ